VYMMLRMIYTECPAICPCGEMCSNQRIQRREWLSRCLEKFLTDDRGFGVRTTHHINAGMFRHSTLTGIVLLCFVKVKVNQSTI